MIAGDRGLITDLRTEAGQFVGAGAPVMTLIALNDVWINADMTENNLGRIRPGNEVAILLDSMPGHILPAGYSASAMVSTPRNPAGRRSPYRG